MHWIPNIPNVLEFNKDEKIEIFDDENKIWITGNRTEVVWWDIEKKELGRWNAYNFLDSIYGSNINEIGIKDYYYKIVKGNDGFLYMTFYKKGDKLSFIFDSSLKKTYPIKSVYPANSNFEEIVYLLWSIAKQCC